MELVADRFLVLNQARTIDLASGEDVVLIVSTSGGRSEQVRWAARCDGLSRVVHPALAELVDYGVFGEMKRFEAWRCRNWVGRAVAPPTAATATGPQSTWS